MDIKFFYKDNHHSYKREYIISALANALETLIDLPTSIEVCLYNLGENVYGGIDSVRTNRVCINYDLPLEIVPKIFTHELIHVHQKHIGLLKIKRDGVCSWRGVQYTNKSPESLSYQEYQNLPWERDVSDRLPMLLQQAFDLVTTKKVDNKHQP